MADNSKFLFYRDKPLVRYENIIFYGSIADEYTIMMQILESEKYAGTDSSKATKVAVQLQKNSADGKTEIVKETVKPNMAQAMETSVIWLERALKEAKNA